MILQKLEIQNENIPSNCFELFYRTEAEDRISIGRDDAGNTIVLKPQGEVSFDTYFNGFSVEKWQNYTIIDQLQVEIEYDGVLNVYLMGIKPEGEHKELITIAHRSLESAVRTKESILLDINELSGIRICYLKMINVSAKDAEVFAVNYSTNMLPLNEVRLAISICTYKREKDLHNNLNIIEDRLINNPMSVLYNKLKVFVIDNGSTVKYPERPGLTVFTNKNCGGSGGFARGMLEVSNRKEYTHILLMDDDVVVMPSAIEKTYALLLYLRKEKQEHMIGGAMFRRDYPYILHECGGRYFEGQIESIGNGKDLRRSEEVFLNEEMTHADYNAWWYCCIPLSVIRKKGLPLPLFIHQDDIEYGLRTGSRILTMNGISLWHEAFEHKRPSANEYYDVRNILIINSFLETDFRLYPAIRLILLRMLINMFKYRYRDVKLVAKAVDDYCKGPVWLLTTDGEGLNSQIISMGYKNTFEADQSQISNYTVLPEEIMEKPYNSQRMGKRKLLLLNGLFFPATTGKSIVYIPAGHSASKYYRVNKACIYDPESAKGFMVERSLCKSMISIGIIIGKIIKFAIKYKKLQYDYAKAYPEFVSEDFWKTYLELK